jgi:hypothetical protein
MTITASDGQASLVGSLRELQEHVQDEHDYEPCCITTTLLWWLEDIICDAESGKFHDTGESTGNGTEGDAA